LCQGNNANGAYAIAHALLKLADAVGQIADPQRSRPPAGDNLDLGPEWER